MLLPLYALPGEKHAWQDKVAELLRDPYLKGKYDRDRRLREARQYLDDFIKPIQKIGLFIDIGPGPGELMEVARVLGFSVLGYDAPSGQGGMGDKYLELSRLLHRRQRLDVRYGGVEQFVGHSEGFAGTAAVVNLRGSIEQCFAEHLDGPPHHLHHDRRQQRWKFDDSLRAKIHWFVARIAVVLGKDGIAAIHCNGTGDEQNTLEFDLLLTSAAVQAGLTVADDSAPRAHRWRKCS